MVKDPKIQTLLDAMADYESQWKSTWAVDDATGTFLYQKVLNLKPQRILELGTWRGASAIYIAAALAENGTGVITTVDKDEERAEDAKANFLRSGLGGHIDQQTIDIDTFLGTNDIQYDMVFLDAAKKPYGRWLKELLNKHSHEQTVIFIDDVITMKDKMGGLYEFIEGNDSIHSKIYHIDDGIMEVQRNTDN